MTDVQSDPIAATAAEVDPPAPVPPPDPETAIEHRDPEQAPQLIDPDQLGRPATPVGSATVGLSVIPPETEMRALAQLANTLAMADACPRPLMRKPNDVFLVLLTARDLGTAITTALREFHVIEGRVTLSPKVKLAMVRARPDLGRIRPAPDNDEESATWHSWRADSDGVCVSSTYTWRDAQLAHLVDQRCTAYSHWPQQGSDTGRKGDAKCLCKQNWKSYPKRMLSWRALGYLLDDEYPEVGTGLYSPDEMGAVTDEDGEPIPVTAVESLPGMKRPQGQTASSGEADDDPPASPEDIAEMTARLHAAKDHPEAKAELQAWWTEREIGVVSSLPARRVGMLRARFAALEAKHGYSVDTPAAVAEGAEPTAEPERGAESQNGPAQNDGDDPAAEVDPMFCEGDVAGWLIRRAGGMNAAEIKASFRAGDHRVPDGNVNTLRAEWGRWQFELLGGGLLAAFGIPAEQEAA